MPGIDNLTVYGSIEPLHHCMHVITCHYTSPQVLRPHQHPIITIHFCHLIQCRKLDFAIPLYHNPYIILTWVEFMEIAVHACTLTSRMTSRPQETGVSQKCFVQHFFFITSNTFHCVCTCVCVCAVIFPIIIQLRSMLIGHCVL